jgi:hypothetical protein
MLTADEFGRLVSLYFPGSEYDRAWCIATRECPPTPMPQSGIQFPECVKDEGLIDCGAGPVQAKSWGVFGILDACWDPSLNPDSPFTPELWSRVLEPNVNVWMASVIWSANGWRAWTSCEPCNACDVMGGPIPYPRGPVEDVERLPSLARPLVLVGLGAAFVGLAIADQRP